MLVTLIAIHETELGTFFLWRQLGSPGESLPTGTSTEVVGGGRVAPGVVGWVNPARPKLLTIPFSWP